MQRVVREFHPGGVFSRAGFSQDYFKDLLQKDGAIQILVKFHYFDASLKEDYTSSFCMERFSNGSIGLLSEEECKT